LASENKSTERIYPEKFPQEILDEWNSFIQWRLKCGDFEYSKNKDHFIYSWAFAFKNVLVIVNPFGRSMGSPTQFVRIICAGLFFYSVPFFSSKIQLGLMPNWIFRDLTLFNEIYKFLAFYIGGLFLRTLSGKSIVAAYVLAFVPLVWVFKTNLVAGFASLLFLLSGIARQKTPSGNAI
jgi:hypothetical protein